MLGLRNAKQGDLYVMKAGEALKTMGSAASR